MLTADISKDYLAFDFLVPIGYFVRTGDSTWGPKQDICNCWFQDTTRTTILNGGDLRKKYGCVTIWMNEWFNPAILPQRGDKFTLDELQTGGDTDLATPNTYIVTEVDVDTNRSKAMRLHGYRINGT